MPTQEDGTPVTLPSSGDLSAAQYKCIKVDGNGRAAVAGAGEVVIGICNNKPSALGDMTVIYRLDGSRRKALIGAAGLVAGALVASDSTGRLVSATKASVNTSDGGTAQDAVAGSFVIGVAITGGSVGEFGTFISGAMGCVATTAV